LFRYCSRTHLRISRSRPERKNDNCYVEQKNFDTVRKLVGYARFTSPEAVELLNRLYAMHGLLQNYIYPSQRLVEKVRLGSTVKKRHDVPKTPVARLLERNDIDESIKMKVRNTIAEINPLEVAAEVIRLQRELLRYAVTHPTNSHLLKETRAR
ncbi:MAG: hypothetical protein AB1798_09130, partial [Spirochaetota bacterium]